MLDWVSPAQEPHRVAFRMSSGNASSEGLAGPRASTFLAATPTASKLVLTVRKRLHPLVPRSEIRSIGSQLSESPLWHLEFSKQHFTSFLG